MKEVKGIHDGERVFILGNGPSLSETPLEDLEEEYTIALNKIDLLYKNTTWRPTYYVFYDVVHYEKDGMSKELLNSVEKNIMEADKSFISSPGEKYFGEKEDIYYFEYNQNNNPAKRNHAIKNGEIENYWSNDISDKIFITGSTIIAAAQIAAYMGFDEIYLLGCDLYEPSDYLLKPFKSSEHPLEYSFEDDKSNLGKFYNYLSYSDSLIKSSINLIYFKSLETVINIMGMASLYNPLSHENHFSKEYTNTNVVFGERKNKMLREVHTIIKLASKEYGFDVYNATPNGYLEIYDRVDLEKVISEDENEN